MLDRAPPLDVAAAPTRRERYLARKAEVLAPVQRGAMGTRIVRATLRRLSLLTEETLREVWQGAGLDAPLALVAVGGFGRSEMFPHSDVDVLVLLPDDVVAHGNGELAPKIEAFVTGCWDTGLEIGSSVRTVAECLSEAKKDLTVQTSLLESRLIAGDAQLFASFRKRFMTALDPRAFFIAKTLEMRQRHTKYENTPYALEPNCKESPGGLRDLQVILWVAKATGLGSSWDQLAERGLATPFEVQQLKRNEALLSLIRTRLHLLANRREDRLVFDLQTAVAESFGFRSESPDGHRLPIRASEALMRRYYWAAKAVTQLNQILILNIEERLGMHSRELRRINEHFNARADLIEVASDDLYLRHPQAILETFLLYQTHVVRGFSARTLRALYNARHVMDAKFRSDPVNRATFMQILCQPSGITHVLRLMNQTSVLGRYLWAFRGIVGQMQHDLYHVYTVDSHSLMVVRNMRRFFMAEHAHEYPFCSELADRWDKPWLLYVAALFHDIGKGRGGDHSVLGAQDALQFCKQHGIAREDAKLIEFLVLQHLSMSRVAQKEDLSDPDVIAAFAERVGDERRLTALYLLTVADIRGTSPKVWTAWKGKLLEDLYRYTLRAINGDARDPQAEVSARKREALVQLKLHGEPFEGHKALWDTLDVSYFMRHDVAEITWHARQLSRHVAGKRGKTKDEAASAQAADRPAIVRARRSLVDEGLQVLVYTRDQPDLFARICGYFDQADFNIVDARIHTTRNGWALDTFQLVTTLLPEHYRELTSMVEAGLSRALQSSAPLAAPSRGRTSRRVKSFPVTPRVELQPDERGQHWLLSISASDRAGLLYSVSRVLAQHQIDVQLAKISTLGERVEDTFLIKGRALEENRKQIEIETELLEALAPN